MSCVIFYRCNTILVIDQSAYLCIILIIYTHTHSLTHSLTHLHPLSIYRLSVWTDVNEENDPNTVHDVSLLCRLCESLLTPPVIACQPCTHYFCGHCLADWSVTRKQLYRGFYRFLCVRLCFLYYRVIQYTRLCAYVLYLYLLLLLLLLFVINISCMCTQAITPYVPIAVYLSKNSASHRCALTQLNISTSIHCTVITRWDSKTQR